LGYRNKNKIMTTTDQVVFKLEVTFNDLLDGNEELKSKFKLLNKDEQSKFIETNMNAISNGMGEGTDYSTVMSIVSDILIEDLDKSNVTSRDYKDELLLAKLGKFLSIEEGTEDEVLEKWNSLTTENDSDLADDHFTMWQPLEYSLTIKQLAEQL